MSPRYPCCGLYLQEKFSEEEWAQLEEAASCAQVVKVEVDVNYSDRANRVLAAGFKKNKVVREVTLSGVPSKVMLSLQTVLTTEDDDDDHDDHDEALLLKL